MPTEMDDERVVLGIGNLFERTRICEMQHTGMKIQLPMTQCLHHIGPNHTSKTQCTTPGAYILTFSTHSTFTSLSKRSGT